MTQNNIGKTVYVADELPATNDAAGFEALTWVKASGVQSIGGIGITHSGIDIPDLQTGFTRQVKGAGAGTDSVLTFRHVSSDAGQGDLKTLGEGKQGVGSVKIVRGSGTAEAPATDDPVRYAQGYFHSYTPNEDSVTTHGGFSVTFRNNAVAIDAVNPTVT